MGDASLDWISDDSSDDTSAKSSKVSALMHLRRVCAHAACLIVW